jgi:small-conductance mechanosensitive channel
MPERTPDGVPTREDDAPVAVVDEGPVEEHAVVDEGPVAGADRPAGEARPVAARAPGTQPGTQPVVTRPRADAVALAVALVVPLVGVLLTLAARTWLTVAFLVLTPVILVVYGLGLAVFVRVLRRRSTLRRELGAVPARYRGYAWLWAVAFLAAALSPTLGSLDLPWTLQAGLVGASAIVVGVVTGAVWSTYLRDVARVDVPRED